MGLPSCQSAPLNCFISRDALSGGLLLIAPPRLYRPLSRLLPPLRPSSIKCCMGPTHSHIRPTSPLRLSLTAARTLELSSTFFCTFSHNCCRLDEENSVRRTSSRSCVMLIPGSGKAPESWAFREAWLASLSNTLAASCFARASVARPEVILYRPYVPDVRKAMIRTSCQIYRSTVCRRDRRMLQESESSARDVEASRRPPVIL